MNRIRQWLAELSILIGVLLALAVVLIFGKPLWKDDEE